MKRLERNRKLKARNNGPAYTSMHKGIQSDPHFSSSERALWSRLFVGERIFRGNVIIIIIILIFLLTFEEKIFLLALHAHV